LGIYGSIAAGILVNISRTALSCKIWWTGVIQTHILFDFNPNKL
jgi:hypothetical protein